MTIPSTHNSFSKSNWYQALGLRERLLVLAAPNVSNSLALTPTGSELADKTIARWRKNEPFKRDETWKQCLNAIDVTAEELRAVAGTTSEDLGERIGQEPDWLLELRDAYQQTTGQAVTWPDTVDSDRLPFLTIFEPLIEKAMVELRATAQAIADAQPGAPFTPATVVDALSGHLPDHLVPLVTRALLVELHVAGLEEKLSGESSEDRFLSFIELLRQPEFATTILAQYPVLARKVLVRIHQWRDSSIELLRRLADDAEQIREQFAGGAEMGSLVEARGAISDPHNDGRGVHLLRFDSGLELVYKPRPLAVAAAFQGLLGWVNEHGFEPKFRVLEVLDAGEYGWVEFVVDGPCTSKDEARRFYRRQGGYVALLSILDGTDFHHENLIAAGEHPVLVDLETLFQPWVDGRSLDKIDRQPFAALHDSVLKCGLLPQRVWGTKDAGGVDLSGLAARDGQLTPEPVATTTDRLTDKMRVHYARIEIPIEASRARLGDEALSPLPYAGELRDGFRCLFELVLKFRDQLIAADGPLFAFEAAPVRIIFRNTATYGDFLIDGFHPHFLGSALEQQTHYRKLWAETARRPFLSQIVPHELRDLDRGDVPHFQSPAGSRDLFASDGQRLENFFEDSGLDRVKRRLEQLSERDMRRQQSAIDDSLEMLRRGEQEPRPTYMFKERVVRASPDELITAATQVCDRLVDRAFEGRDEACWLSIDYSEKTSAWEVVPAGADLYLGLPGIALALGYVGELAGKQSYCELARKAMHAQSKLIEDQPKNIEAVGGFNGWGGIVYALTQLGALWKDDELLGQAEVYAHRLQPLIEKDELLDVIAGSAGCLLALLNLAQVRPSTKTLELARLCGDRLLERGQRQSTGLGWITPISSGRALAGISHGGAGISLALMRLYGAVGDERYLRGAREGIAYERSIYCSKNRNWPDLRSGSPDEHADEEHFMCAWCHGAPGVGLARVAGLSYFDSAQIRGEIDQAVATTIETGFGTNHSLCHGDLGNLDFLLEAARVTGKAELTERVYRMAGSIVDSIDRDGWLFGVPGNMETPGLMMGLGGLAYGLARLADPDRVPSVLSLAPPPGACESDTR